MNLNKKRLTCDREENEKRDPRFGVFGCSSNIPNFSNGVISQVVVLQLSKPPKTETL